MERLEFILCAMILCASSARADVTGTNGVLPIRIEESTEGTEVFLERDLIVEFSRNHQFLNFRASGENTLWVGETRYPIDLCWAYRDKGSPDLKWERSRQLSGDNDWMEITLVVIVADGEKTPRTIVLEQEGPGQSWFDNVVIEKLDD